MHINGQKTSSSIEERLGHAGDEPDGHRRMGTETGEGQIGPRTAIERVKAAHDAMYRELADIENQIQRLNEKLNELLSDRLEIRSMLGLNEPEAPHVSTPVKRVSHKNAAAARDWINKSGLLHADTDISMIDDALRAATGIVVSRSFIGRIIKDWWNTDQMVK